MAAAFCTRTSTLTVVLLTLICYVEGNSFTGVQDVRKLIQNYNLICGTDYLCHPEKYGIEYVPSESYRNLNLCPICSCDDVCHSRGNCCPDLFFQYPDYDCKNLTIQCSSLTSCSNLYRTASKCPQSSDADLDTVTKCESSYTGIELLRNPPVMSLTSGVSYNNRYCAYCNNEHNNTALSSWYLDVSCADYGPLNFLSSYEEILETAKEIGCEMSFSPEDKNTYRCDRYDKRVKYDKCNQTGTWDVYDQDIDFACESSYKFTFSEYKNIFCFICNPPRHNPSPVIDKCNSSGLAYSSDDALWNACAYNPGTPLTHPYKNVFCHLCNRRSYLSHIYNNFNGILKNSYHLTSFIYYFSITSYFEDVILENIKKNADKKNFSKVDDDSIIWRNGYRLNITNLLMKKFAVNPEVICRTDLLPHNLSLVASMNKGCSCDPRCLFFQRDTCCADIALTYPITCMSEKVHTYGNNPETDKTFLVTNDCYKNGFDNESYFKSVRDLCFANSDSYASFPVDDGSAVSYVNIYCHLCNTGYTYNESTDSLTVLKNYKPWQMEIHCNEELFFKYYLDIFDIIASAQYLGCDITIGSTKRTRCDTVQGLVGQCNVTGKWSDPDEDVKWACESLSGHALTGIPPFKNEFCLLCNPNEPLMEKPTDHCNQSLAIDPIVEEACNILPSVQHDIISPYKNVFCALCSGCIACAPMYRKLYVHHGDSSLNIPVVFDDLFDLQFFPIEVGLQPPVDEILEVKDGYIFDKIKGVTRNMSCYPGRHLENNQCDVLLPITKDLQYTLRLTAEAVTPLGGVLENEFFDSVRDAIFQMIWTTLPHCSFESFYILTNMKCTEDTIPKNTTFLAYIQLTLFFHYKIDRNYTEHLMHSLVKGQFEFTLNNQFNTTFIGKKADVSINIPNAIENTAGLLCSSRHTLFPFFDLYRNVFVSNMMVCTIVIFAQDEYIVDIARSTITIEHLEQSFTEHHYLITPEYGSLGVCLEDIRNHFSMNSEVKVNTLKLNLEYLTLFCSILSLVCLFITFVIYSLCSELRTVPGKILMSIVFSMFFAQCLFQFGTERTEVTSVCQIIGIASHFFWLAVFFNINCSCIHMFRRLANMNIEAINNQGSSALPRYLAYSYSVPAIFVIMTLVVSYAETSTSGYGGYICFLSRGVIFIVMFIAPITTICCVNCFLFMRTAHRIFTMPSLARTSKRNEFSICLKLFTITGITWLFQIMEAFFPDISSLSYVATVVNGLQGFFIFISFVCNRNVLSSFKTKFRRSKSSSTNFSDIKSCSSSNGTQTRM